ncbi:MAG: hypothetical protein ABIG03_05000 [Candidatus Eisenbacteria bacterium]
MGLLKQLNALIWSFNETWRAAKKGVALWPFAIYAGAQCVVALMVVGFAYPPMSWVAVPLLRWRLGEPALHYPANLFALRPALAQVDSVMLVVLGAVLTATAVHLFAAYFAGRREGLREGWRSASRRYLPLLAVAAVLVAATHLVSRAPFTLLGEMAESSPGKFRIVRFGSIGLVVVLQALFLYSTAYLVLGGRRLIGAVGGSLRLAVTTPLTTLLVVGIPALLELLPLWLSRQSATIVDRLSPEFLIVVMLLWVAVIFVAAYATAGAATRFFLFSTQDDDEGTEREGAR